ncbi:MAG: protein kinase [Xanthomonadales bacterium]|nr:protein kinase [Xanthomonadales bacterium]
MNETTIATPASGGSGGERIGAWRILRRLGVGGMGEVYLAERADGHFEQTAALKRVQGHLSEESRSRFLTERQLLSRLQHPNIAHLIDGGEDRNGQPYLVMEYVEGAPIDQHLARADLNHTLHLFLQLCDAVAYAHRQLVLHRDIKPSNVLVTPDGQIKLLDFGIAKLLREHGDERTRHAENIYTPSYASPEQVAGEAMGAGSDVYSLGVLLYRLLTGLDPDPRRAAGSASTSATTRVSTPPSDAVLDNANWEAAQRRQRSRQLHGDLDAIVDRALRADPSERYASVEALANDLQRYRQHLPVTAVAPSLGYRLRRFLRRNALPATAATLLLLSLVGGLVSSLHQARIAERERERAEARFNDVRSLAKSMLFDIHDAIARLTGSTQARQVLVETAEDYLSRLDADEDAPLDLKREIAEAWLRIGDVQGLPSQANLGDTAAALKSYDRAEAAANAVLAREPENRGARIALAQVVLHRANTLFFTEQLAASGENLKRAEVLWHALEEDGVDEASKGLVETFYFLGLHAFWTDDLKAAIRYYDAALQAIARSSLDPTSKAKRRIQINTQRADALSWDGRQAEARVALNDVIATLDGLRKVDPNDAELRAASAVAWVKLGESYEDTDEPDAAERLLDAYQHAQVIHEQISKADPADLNARRMLALTTRKLGYGLALNQRYDEGMRRLQQALDTFRQMAASDPANMEHRRDTANTLYRMSQLEQLRKHPAAAVPYAEEILGIRRDILRSAPESTIYHRDLAITLDLLVELQPGAPDNCARIREAHAIWTSLKDQGAAFESDSEEMQTTAELAAACDKES